MDDHKRSAESSNSFKKKRTIMQDDADVWTMNIGDDEVDEAAAASAKKPYVHPITKEMLSYEEADELIAIRKGGCNYSNDDMDKIWKKHNITEVQAALDLVYLNKELFPYNN